MKFKRTRVQFFRLFCKLCLKWYYSLQEHIFQILLLIFRSHSTTIHHNKTICRKHDPGQCHFCWENLFQEHKFHILRQIIISHFKRIRHDKSMCLVCDPYIPKAKVTCQPQVEILFLKHTLNILRPIII